MAGFSTDPQLSLDRVLNVPKVSRVDQLPATYQLDDCVKWIQENGYSKVCLQLPDAFLPDAVNISFYIERNTSGKVYILGDTTFGSCCVDEIAAQHVSGDAVIHFGHACLSPVSIPVLYIFPKTELNVDMFCGELRNLKWQGQALILYDVGYSHIIDVVRNSIPDDVKQLVVLSELDVGSKHVNACSSSCQLLAGKDKHSNLRLARAFCLPESDIDLVIYIGKMDNANLENFRCALKGLRFICYSDADGFQEVSETNVLKRCSYLVERLKTCDNIGILVGTLGVKGYLEAVTHVKNLCNRAKKRSYIIAVGKPNVAKLSNFPEIDIFVAIACVEVQFGDEKNFIQPIVRVFEVDLAFNENRTWDSSYSRDFRDLIPGGKEYIPYPKEDFVGGNESVLLTSSKIKTTSTVTSDSSDLVVRPEMALAPSNSSSFSRTWYGLDQSLDNTNVTLATAGRTGIASGYTNETETTENNE